MKIIITEDQLKTAVFQNAVDMAWKDIANNIKEEDYYTDGGYGDNYEAVTKVEVVNAYKTESYVLKGVKIIELAIIIYINTIIDTFDAGDYFWDFKLNLETYLGKTNFRFKLLNVINENPKSDL